MMTSDLLTIDVASELRNLCEAQLRGTWQIPAELVRLAFRLGATETSLDRRGRGFTIRWPGAVLDEKTLRMLATALDVSSESSERQQAITDIERAGAESMLWAAGLRGSRLEISSTDGEARLILRYRDGGWPRITKKTVASDGGEVILQWSCSGLKRRRAEAWLEMAVRFADQPVTINGAVAQSGFSGGMFHLRMDHPIPARLGLTRSGEEPVLWLLKNGVVAARAGLPGYPPFEAAIEMADEVPGWASSADLRRAVSPFLSEIVDRVVWMMLEVSGRWSDFDTATRQRLVVLLLRAAGRRLRSDQVRRLQIVPTVAGECLSIDEIQMMASQRGGLLAAIESLEEVAGAVVDPGSTLCVSGEVRALLAELADVRFHTPQTRRRRRLHGVLLKLRALRRTIGRRTRALFGAKVVAEDGLSSRERRTLALIRSTLEDMDPAFCDGSGPTAQNSRQVIFGRHDPVLVDAGRVLAKEPRWVYPVMLALEVVGASEEHQKAWRRAVGIRD